MTKSGYVVTVDGTAPGTAPTLDACNGVAAGALSGSYISTAFPTGPCDWSRMFRMTRSPKSPQNREHVLRVLGMHREAAASIDEEDVGLHDRRRREAQAAWLRRRGAPQRGDRFDAVVISSDVLKVEVGGVVLKEGMLDYYTEFGRDYVQKLYDAFEHPRAERPKLPLLPRSRWRARPVRSATRCPAA